MAHYSPWDKGIKLFKEASLLAGWLQPFLMVMVAVLLIACFINHSVIQRLQEGLKQSQQQVQTLKQDLKASEANLKSANLSLANYQDYKTVELRRVNKSSTIKKAIRHAPSIRNAPNLPDDVRVYTNASISGNLSETVHPSGVPGDSLSVTDFTESVAENYDRCNSAVNTLTHLQSLIKEYPNVEIVRPQVSNLPVVLPTCSSGCSDAPTQDSTEHSD